MTPTTAHRDPTTGAQPGRHTRTDGHAPEPTGPAAPDTTIRGPRAALAQVVRGAVMGAADVVPGVSGGTVALVLGIYRSLIESLHAGVQVLTHALKGDLRGAGSALRAVPWLWLGSLGTGILATVLVLAGPLTTALETYPMPLAGLFVGLVAGAVILCRRQMERTTGAHLALAAVAAVATFVLLGLSPAASAAGAAAPLWAFFIGGAIAICAMILPGISGSFLLVLMGLYSQVIGAVAARDLVTLGVFALGCLTGLALGSSALRWLLTRYHDLVIAAMVGLMIGSIRILWPWPGGLDSTALALPGADTWLAPTLLAALGLSVVLGIDALARRLSARR